MRKVILLMVAVIAAGISGCRNGAAENDRSDVIEINFSEEYYDDVMQNAKDISFVILHEDDNTMFNEIDKLLATDWGFYVLDRLGSKKVVAFDCNGRPVASYGRVGQGPGEYIWSWDIDVDTTGVYVLDRVGKKVLHFAHDGEFLGEDRISFFADAFKRLSNGNFLFNTQPMGEGDDGERFQITDSEMNLIAKTLPYPKEYVGGWGTSDIFRPTGNGFLYYRSPTDTIIEFDPEGNIMSCRILDFKDRNIDEIAKLNYLEFDGEGKNYIAPVNSPIAVSESLWFILADNEEDNFAIALNPDGSASGMKSMRKNPSVYDLMWPLGSIKGSVITQLNEALTRNCNDVESLPDSVQTALDEGLNVLMIVRMK